jgi:hypothetical protein
MDYKIVDADGHVMEDESLFDYFDSYREKDFQLSWDRLFPSLDFHHIGGHATRNKKAFGGGKRVGPKEDLLVGCNTVFDTAGGKWTANADRDTNTAAPQYIILDAETGNIDKHVLGVGAGDEVWFNRGDGNYYTASSESPLAPNAITPARPPVGTATTAPVLTAQGAAVLGVIDAKRQELLQLVPTFNVPAVTTGSNQHPAGTAHSVAANAENNHVFVPLAANNVFPTV